MSSVALTISPTPWSSCEFTAGPWDTSARRLGACEDLAPVHQFISYHTPQGSRCSATRTFFLPCMYRAPSLFNTRLLAVSLPGMLFPGSWQKVDSFSAFISRLKYHPFPEAFSGLPPNPSLLCQPASLSL